MSRATEAELRRRITEGSRDSEDFRQLAGFLTEAGKTAPAVELLEQALALPLSAVARAETLAQLAWLLHERTKQTDQARSLAEDGLASLYGELETREALFARGMLESVLAHNRQLTDAAAGTQMARRALATFERLLSAHPDWDEEEAWLETARLYCWLGDGERAVPLAQRFLQADLEGPHRLCGLLVLSEGHQLLGRLAEAEVAAAEALRCSEDYRDLSHLAAHQLGLVQKEMGRPDDARQSLERALAALETHQALRDDPWWRRALHGRLAEVHAELGEHNKAADSWRELLGWYGDDDPTRVQVMLWLADSLYGAGEFADARRLYETVAATPLASEEQRVDAQVWALWSAAQFHHLAGEHETAARLFERLLDRYRDDDTDRRNVLGWLGDCLYALGAFGRARERYEEVLASPHASEAEKARTQQFADQAAARFHYDNAQYAEAAQAFERVIDRLSSHDREPWTWLLWLAACYRQMGADGAARRCYKEVASAPNATKEDRAHAQEALADLGPDS